MATSPESGDYREAFITLFCFFLDDLFVRNFFSDPSNDRWVHEFWISLNEDIHVLPGLHFLDSRPQKILDIICNLDVTNEADSFSWVVPWVPMSAGVWFW